MHLFGWGAAHETFCTPRTEEQLGDPSQCQRFLRVRGLYNSAAPKLRCRWSQVRRSSFLFNRIDFSLFLSILFVKERTCIPFKKPTIYVLCSKGSDTVALRKRRVLLSAEALNHTAVQKIIKKFDKRFHAPCLILQWRTLTCQWIPYLCSVRFNCVAN